MDRIGMGLVTAIIMDQASMEVFGGRMLTCSGITTTAITTTIMGTEDTRAEVSGADFMAQAE